MAGVKKLFSQFSAPFQRGSEDALRGRTPRNVYEDSVPSSSENGSERLPYTAAAGGLGAGVGGGTGGREEAWNARSRSMGSLAGSSGGSTATEYSTVTERTTMTESTEASLYVEDTIRAGWNPGGGARGVAGAGAGADGDRGVGTNGLNAQARERGDGGRAHHADAGNGNAHAHGGTRIGGAGEDERERERGRGSDNWQQPAGGRQAGRRREDGGGAPWAYEDVLPPPLLGLSQWQRSLSLGAPKKQPLFHLADLSFVIDVIQEDRWVLTHTAKGLSGQRPSDHFFDVMKGLPLVQGLPHDLLPQRRPMRPTDFILPPEWQQKISLSCVVSGVPGGNPSPRASAAASSWHGRGGVRIGNGHARGGPGNRQGGPQWGRSSSEGSMQRMGVPFERPQRQRPRQGQRLRQGPQQGGGSGSSDYDGDTSGASSGVSSDLTAAVCRVWYIPPRGSSFPPSYCIQFRAPLVHPGAAVSCTGVVKSGTEREELIVTLELRRAPEGAPQAASALGLGVGARAWYDWEAGADAGAREWWHAVRVSLQVAKKGAEVPSSPAPRSTASGPLPRPPRSGASSMHRSRSGGSMARSASASARGSAGGTGPDDVGNGAGPDVGNESAVSGRTDADRGSPGPRLSSQSGHSSRKGPAKGRSAERSSRQERPLRKAASGLGTPLADVEEDDGDDGEDMGGEWEPKGDAEQRKGERKLATMVLRDQ